jgi:uncharacterized pyridoxamine 5'-phosphate oxidase family protein
LPDLPLLFNFELVLKANPNGVLATWDGQGVRTRVFQYLFAVERKAALSLARAAGA